MSGRELDPDGTDSFHPHHPWEQVGHPLYIAPSRRTKGNWPPDGSAPVGPHESALWAALPEPTPARTMAHERDYPGSHATMCGGSQGSCFVPWCTCKCHAWVRAQNQAASGDAEAAQPLAEGGQDSASSAAPDESMGHLSHAALAEKQLASVEGKSMDVRDIQATAAVAQVHATLALAETQRTSAADVWDAAMAEFRKAMLQRSGTYEADIDVLALENPYR